jgi:hypothetical protein
MREILGGFPRNMTLLFAEESFETHFQAIVDIKGIVSGNETPSIFRPTSIHNR